MPTSKNNTSDVNYGFIAQDLLFAGKLDFARHGVVYRAGKTADDVRAAVRRAMNPKNGHGKTEHELSMLEGYLKGILKSAPPQPVAA